MTITDDVLRTRFIIRDYLPSDAVATMGVFRRAVVVTASHDYDSQQIRAWAGHTGTQQQWNAKRLVAHTRVAQVAQDMTMGCDAENTGVCGFIDVDDTGYIDMLFVDPAYARHGVATMLLAQVEQFAAARGIDQLTVHASITARPFFTRHGFRTLETRYPIVDGIEFTNYAMAKP